MTGQRQKSLRERQLVFREGEILRTAAELLGEEGCRAMTMGEVSSRLGISKATLYSHFDSKADLVRTVLESSADETLDGVHEVLEATGPDEDRLRAICCYLLEQLLRLSPGTGPVTCCCLAEVACPYGGWDGVEALLAEHGAVTDEPVPLGEALRALAALVEHRRRREGRAPTREDAGAILRHLFPQD